MKISRLSKTLTFFALLVVSVVAARSAEKADFDRRVAPVLASYCLECHSGAEPEGKLDLSRRELAMRGGESGPAIEPANLADSLLWQRIADGEMPPKEKLPDDAKAQIKSWIAAGAKWGSDPIDPFRFTTSKRAGLDWWALQPLTNPQPPKVETPDTVRTPIDAFIIDRLQAKGLALSTETSARALVRRLHFDLIGLPPAPEVVEQFVREPTEEAYKALVDKLLASPEYGERWGRHWLDVVRFGESDGFERNSPRKNLWPYRDWIIQAFNDDMPYDQFAQMQIVGDIVTNNSPDGIAAVGFLVAGVHNTVVGGSEFMKRTARADELEEVTGTLAQTFVGLTVNCARCHDHKFDPIKQEEFYRMTSALSGVNHGEREVQSVVDHETLAALKKQRDEISSRLNSIEEKAREKVLAARKSGESTAPEPPAPFARWEFDGDFEDRIGSLHGKAVGGARLENGALVVDGKGAYVATTPLGIDLAEKTLEAWVMLDNLEQRGGGVISVQTTNGVTFDAIVFGEREAKRWMAGSNGFVRTSSFQAPEETEAAGKPVHFAIVYQKDGTITGYRNGQLYGKGYKSQGLQSYKAGETQVAFGLRHGAAGGNRMLSGKILRAQLYNRALSPDAVAASAGVESDYVPEKELLAQLTEDERKQRGDLKSQRDQLSAEIRSIESSAKRKIYTVTPRNPGETRFLPRGDVMNPGRVVSPGAVAAIAGLTGEFGLLSNAPEAERRRELAAWITDRNNPLFTRVIANRLWHYHFGAGIVDTPNDLGFNGGRPSHPELLDWLASQVIENGYRLKPLHRLIVTSSVYRQSSKFDERAAKVDAANRLLWRKSPVRLEAEALRDSLLHVGGRLNPQRGGPGFEDVSIKSNNGTTYYAPLDREDEQFNRRTVYRFLPRGGRSALLDSFDCPDPSATAPRRSVTTTPLQALSLLNNAFVLRMTDHFAARVQREAGDDARKQVERAYQLAYNRAPDDEELKLAADLVGKHGLSALTRALFNSNEFVIVE